MRDGIFAMLVPTDVSGLRTYWHFLALLDSGEGPP